MTTIDYEALNTQAALLHDSAKAMGYREGSEAGRLEAAARHADTALAAADIFLEHARHVGEGDTSYGWSLASARRMLGQTPLLAERDTMQAIAALDNAGRDDAGADQDHCGAALDHCGACGPTVRPRGAG